MNLTSENPFWSIQNGLLGTYPALDRDLVCEAVVCGGGISGALIAHHLIAAGVDTILVDKRDIGTGSTSASTGLLQYEVDVPLRELINRIGRKKACRSYQICGEAIDKIGNLIHRLKIQCDFEKRPSLFLARNRKEIPELREEFRLRREIGFDLRFIESQQIQNHFHFDRPAGLFSEKAGQVDPHRLTHSLLAEGHLIGLHIYDRTEISRFIPTRQGIRLLSKNGHSIRARRAVIAAGFESKKLLPGEAGFLKSTYALISEPVKDLCQWYRRCLIWESGMPYLYLRTTRDNRIIVGGEDEDFVNPRLRDALIPQKARILSAKFKNLFPDLKLDVAYSWAGTFGQTKDGLAYIGAHQKLPHAFFALGYGGNGITYSLIAAEIVRDAFLGRKNGDASLFAFSR